MTGLEGELPPLARAVFALGVVLALLLAGRWLLARHGLPSAAGTPAADGLRLEASLTLDSRHRVVVVRRGEAELILAVGPTGVARLDRPRTPDAPAPSAP
jgi:flagellar biogenesis protein FliO